MVVKIAMPIVGSRELTILGHLSVLVPMAGLAGVESPEIAVPDRGIAGIAAPVEPETGDEKATTRSPL